MTRPLLLAALALTMAGCEKEYRPEVVTLINVQCEIRKGSQDCVTVIQFPDSTRRQQGGRWGAPEDVFKACKNPDSHYQWTSCPIRLEAP